MLSFLISNAYAMYLKETQFKHFQKQTGYDDYSYTALRIKLDLDPILCEVVKGGAIGDWGSGDGG